MWAVYNVFNNEATIRASLLSVLPYVSNVLVVDGAYRRFPHTLKSGASTDATQKIFRQLCGSKLVWVKPEKVWPSQVAKKNVLLQHVPEDAWFFRLAGDEIVKGKVAEAFNFAESSNFTNIGVRVKNFSPVWPGYKVRHIESHAYVRLDPVIPQEKWSSLEWKPNFGMANRIVRKIRGLHFRGHHSRMYVGSKLMRIQTCVKNVLIINRHYKIGWKRWHQKIEYKRRRYEAGDFEG